MDIKEKRKQYYLDNRNKIIERNKQYYYNNKEKRLKYYYDNREERIKYNYEYWALNGYKYVEKRRNDDDYKLKHNEYYKNYREINKKIKPQNNFLKSTTLNEIVVYFN